jgi:site-specific recombinase XerD
MLKRKIDAYIRNYYETNRNALLITGARQIGKTYSIREFGKTFKSFIEINFLENPDATAIFKGAKSSADILLRLSAIATKPLIKGETLIFFDEVQGDTKGGRVTGRSTAALETNRMLDKMRVRINRHYQEIMERDNFVTAEKVKNAFLGLEHRYHTLMQVFRQHNEDYEKQVEAGMKAKGTLLKYRTVYKHMQEFLDIRYHVKDIALKELTPAFISDFEMFLRTDKHCCTNTVWLYVCPLRTMVFIAINNEWLTRDPFREYEIKKEETTRSFLTKDEIRLLMEGKLKNAKQELYRDLYLFCAFTGLSFADMRNLTEENIRTYFDEHEWININRQKTGVVSNIRLLDIANRIIGKYRGLCGDGRIFPVPHYNTCLAGIRAVAKRCGITKHITWHQSRHTAATTIFLSNGVPIETVSSMLGHKSIKTTQIYAKITKEKLNQDMENLAARLNGVEEFAGCTI